MTVHIDQEKFIAAPVGQVFDLALDVDVHVASLASLGERAIAGVTTGRLALGQQVRWRATHFGVPFTMTSGITELERPQRFVDQQVKGPFRWFRHEHRFTGVEGGTLMIDHVRFQAPLGVVGRIVERALLRRHMRRLIEMWSSHLQAEAARAAGAAGAAG